MCKEKEGLSNLSSMSVDNIVHQSALRPMIFIGRSVRAAVYLK